MIETERLKINSTRPEPKKIKKITDVLEKGGITAFPTETVYGLAALACDKRAVQRIFRLKKRKTAKKLTIQVASVKKVYDLVGHISKPAKIILKEFCPGPVTLILKKAGGTIGIRVPRHKISSAILRKIGKPLAVTSANLSGGKELTEAWEVRKKFGGKIELIVEEKKKVPGWPSTVIDLTLNKWRIVRKGAIKQERIKEVLEKKM